MQKLAVFLTIVFAFVEMLEVVNGSTHPLNIELSVPPLDSHQAVNFIQSQIPSFGPNQTPSRDQHQKPTFSSYEMPSAGSHGPYYAQSVDPYQTLSVRPHQINFGSYQLPNVGPYLTTIPNNWLTRSRADFQSPAANKRKYLLESSEFKYQNNEVFQGRAQYSISSTNSVVYTTTMIMLE